MTTKPIILLSINTAWNIYHFRGSLIQALQAQGYRVVTAAPDDDYTDRLRGIVDDHYVLPMDNAGTSPFRDMLLCYRYWRLLRRVRPSIMLTYTIKPNIYGAFAARALGIPSIANVSGLGTAFIHNNWLTRMVTPLYWLAFRSAAGVFFQNPDDRDLFCDMALIDPNKAALLTGSGVDLDYFRPDDSHKNTASIAFLLVARLLWDKGIGEFIAAAHIVKSIYPNAIFRLVGPTGVRNKTAIPDAVIAAWSGQGVVEYLGASDAVREVIAQHDCVVLPSYREGMPRVLLEAAAMGKPLIASDVPGCRHVVEQGKNGLLCRVRDAQHLAECMIEFIRYSPEQRAHMGRASRAKAEQEFNQQRVLDAYLQKIASILST